MFERLKEHIHVAKKMRLFELHDNRRYKISE